MPLEEQKMLRFLFRLTPSRFSRVVEEDAHEFLMTFRERLYTLGFVESSGADFTVYQLNRPAKEW